VKPVVYTNSDVGLTFEMDFRTLAGQSLNGVPVIANREYKGSVTLVDGETAVVTGSLSQSEQLSMTGIPGLGDVPGINKIMTTNSKMEEVDELLLVITPHVIDASRGQSVEVWMPRVGQ
jgi:Flp pilus assembly secretin CpaC